MDEPIGYAVGNTLEMIEAINFLKGKDMPEDLKEIVLELGSQMIKLAGIGENIEDNKEKMLKQIENGLDADVFMSAGNKQMNKLVNESLIDNSTNIQFLENKVVLIVPKDSDLNISSFEDLKNVDGNIAMGDPSSVPAGQYGKEVLTNLGVWDSVESKLSLGTDVTAVLNQVAQGSAECGIVYSTDAKSNDDVKVVCEAPDDALKTPVIYPVAELKNSEHQDATQKFMEFLKSKEAKDVFVEYGFTIHE